MRIISLVPSLTESLLDFGIMDIVGRTKFCIHPKDQVKDIEIIGEPRTFILKNQGFKTGSYPRQQGREHERAG